MAFDITQADYAAKNRTYFGNTSSLPNALRQLEVAREPWITTPISAQTVASTTASGASPPACYELHGENDGSLIVHPTAAIFSITVWGSHSGLANSWVKIGTISNGGSEFIFNPNYGFICVALDSVSGGSVTADLRLVRA